MIAGIDSGWLILTVSYNVNSHLPHNFAWFR